jgi:hypothetical protein
MRLRWIIVGSLLVVALVAAAATYALTDDEASSGSRSIPQASPAQLAAAGLGKLPLVPRSARVDLEAPPFSNPTRITNPLFPISNLRSAILAGRVEGKPFKVETTLLPETDLIRWGSGPPVETLVSQYVAYLDGELEEVALDRYAQADDGSVWYFGEDVFNYQDGVIADTEGTWIAGKDGPPAMIMPARPGVGDVYMPENIPGLVLEQVTVKRVDVAVEGPQGPVAGAMIGQELHQDGAREDKTFAPGYGEFFTGAGGDVEALALAVPIDGLRGQPSRDLQAIGTGADAAFTQARAKDWKAASATVATLQRAWRRFRGGQVPPRLVPGMSRALEGLARSVGARNSVQARRAAIDVAQAALDLELRHRPPVEIDRARFALWARRLQVDSRAGDSARALGDVATLEWIRDRIVRGLDPVTVTRIDAQLVELRTLVNDEELEGAAAGAARLYAVTRSAVSGS